MESREDRVDDTEADLLAAANGSVRSLRSENLVDFVLFILSAISWVEYSLLYIRLSLLSSTPEEDGEKASNSGETQDIGGPD